MKIVLTKGHNNTSITVNGENAEDITNAEIRDCIEQVMRTIKRKEQLISFLVDVTEFAGKFTNLNWTYGKPLDKEYKWEIDI